VHGSGRGVQCADGVDDHGPGAPEQTRVALRPLHRGGDGVHRGAGTGPPPSIRLGKQEIGGSKHARIGGGS